jgi:hypothetical protein
VNLDRVEAIDRFRQQNLQCVDQPQGAGADVDEPADRDVATGNRLGDA